MEPNNLKKYTVSTSFVSLVKTYWGMGGGDLFFICLKSILNQAISTALSSLHTIHDDTALKQLSPALLMNNWRRWMRRSLSLGYGVCHFTFDNTDHKTLIAQLLPYIGIGGS